VRHVKTPAPARLGKRKSGANQSVEVEHVEFLFWG
jgi:hypothetical protein